MTYLIGFTGVSGSGKTTLVNTLANELNKRGYKTIVVQEVARRVFNVFKGKYNVKSLNDIRCNDTMFVEFQRETLINQLYDEQNAIRMKPHIVLTDRTIYDCMVYTMYFGKINVLLTILQSIPLKVIEPTYRLIFLVEPFTSDYTALDDGVRTPDLEHLDDLQVLFNTIVPYDYKVKPASVEERVKYVIEVLRYEGVL